MKRPNCLWLLSRGWRLRKRYLILQKIVLQVQMDTLQHFLKAPGQLLGTIFFIMGKLLKQINATIIALIPKVQMPARVSEYRPISCCNVLYKVITKLIVKRMQTVLHLLIDSLQNTFVPGRSIANNILLAQELLAGYNQVKRPPRCTIKVDLKKAYDSVEWDYLLEVLKSFNFSTRFIRWIEQCISTANFSISLNGSIYGFFPSTCGLGQGDPMSPYLFVLILESWHTLIRHCVQLSPQFQFHWKCKELEILNLCFVDDVLLFCRADIPSVQTFKDALCEFAALSGLQVNAQKSQIILSRSVQQDKQQIVDLLGFQEGPLPIKYLGIPLVSSRLTNAGCSTLVQKLDSRLAGWNNLNLSFAARAQLIKSIFYTVCYPLASTSFYNCPLAYVTSRQVQDCKAWVPSLASDTGKTHHDGLTVAVSGGWRMRPM
ncbi:UNVERIFIED_CONTAM: hypothetical protein Slati_4275300 [Sesamum latifolium]|uniref:Reverse transcriptase domain-containing protein n=1 Tax=Sesamum latifolium TaxID=2727402 RepID=A0AAW2TDD3_9LAMI